MDDYAIPIADEDGNFDYILLNVFDEVLFDERAPSWRDRYGYAGKLGTVTVFKRKS